MLGYLTLPSVNARQRRYHPMPCGHTSCHASGTAVRKDKGLNCDDFKLSDGSHFSWFHASIAVSPAQNVASTDRGHPQTLHDLLMARYQAWPALAGRYAQSRILLLKSLRATDWRKSSNGARRQYTCANIRGLSWDRKNHLGQ